MRVISKRILREFWEKHSQAKSGLILWYQRISDSELETFIDVRNLFSSADLVGNFTLFNIKGNNYRLITYIDYEYQLLFVRAVLTHAEYDQENWKNDEWFKNS
ncbi:MULTISPECIES: type II toxin-antitoxin system HigB family toxin [unclassified Nodularia (in: cyanobacteria)]|uniref:type II toxin-antitoxin system HigB family toxin n=1 Tax=unclassified Nodularia (in: cyanobacteria) TaxID=2656917 RepID=UPI00187E47F0|nr:MULTISPECIES: type II toxin-antitoxin system HigB family toxin [unclassified Nodularia (in: cyanobacteria)]MBE9198354.1 type II toxin-antitoxin system HigB family toxin [Nodularia sp. LEGE 06071]MCC2691181.1 type II toxin-antitoxin system HigB family toxin [Nodularia sp. LEGE 04288]